LKTTAREIIGKINFLNQQTLILVLLENRGSTLCLVDNEILYCCSLKNSSIQLNEYQLLG
jgi:hypothetical protein